MAQYPSGPFVMKYPMVIDGFSHTLQVNCDVLGEYEVGDDPNTVELRTKGSGGISVQDCADNLWNLVRVLFASVTQCTTYALWKVPDVGNDLSFITGGALTTPNGLSLQPYAKAQQVIFTLRSAGGHVGKLQLMEPWVTSNVRQPFGSAGITGTVALRDFLLDEDSFVIHRDRSFYIAPLNESWGQNEALSRKRFRQ